MAEMMISANEESVWEKGKNVLSANLISVTALVSFVILGVFLIWPVTALFIKSVQGPEGFTLHYYKEFLTKSYYYRSFFNTLFLGILTTSVCIFVGFCNAYMTTRGPVFLRRALRVVSLLPIIAPPYIFALSLIILMGRSGIITKTFDLNWSIYGFVGCVIAQTLSFLPLAYIMIENSLSTLNPNLEDSASNLGASEQKILRSITIPLCAPGILKAALIVFVLSIAEFGNVALLSGRTPFLAPDVYIMITGAESNFNMGSVLSVFLMMPCLVIFLIQGYIIKGKGYTTIVGKPVAAEPRSISPALLILFVPVTILAAILILITFGVVGAGAFTKIVGINNTFVWEHILSTRSDSALFNSVKISLITGFLGAVFGIILAYVIERGKFKGRSFLEFLSLSGFALPGTALAIGYILAFSKPPLHLTGTLMILVLCCVFREFVVGVEAGSSKLKQLSTEMEDASSNLGANTVTTFLRIVLPIIFPAFIYGFIYGFMRTMVTLSAVIFLATPNTYMASIFIFETGTFGELGIACATSLKLIFIVAVSLAILQFLSRWTGLSVTRSQGIGAA
jgi:iron(III) transport system permease protein